LPRMTMTGRGEPQVLATSIVTGNFFSTLGVHASRGRTFTFDESWTSPTPVAVMSDKMWREKFAANPSIVGQTLSLNGKPFTIVGIMPPGFSYPKEGIDLWRTIDWNRDSVAAVFFRRAHGIRVVARLKPGATEAHANAELQAVVDRLKHDYPATNKYMGALMMPLHEYLIGDTRLPLLILLTSVAFLLLIACANVGNLLLVQAAGKEREAALRLALGAGRARLVRAALAESLILSLVGGAAGLALGWAGTRALVRLQPAGMLRVHDFGVDWTVIAFVVGITLLSGLIFGVAPAFWTRHRDPAESLKDGGRGAGRGKQARRWGELLVVGEVALALLMTVGAGLLVRSFTKVIKVDPGFDPHGVLAAEVSLPRAYDTDDKVDAFMRQLEQRLQALPGVTSVGMAMNPPFTGTSWTSDYIAAGRPADGYGTEVGHAIVSPGYFKAMKVQLLRGRTFDMSDARTATPVIVINQALARSYFSGQDPVGQRIAFDKVPTPKSTWYTIIGVVGSEHVDGLDVSPTTEVYESSVQNVSNYMNLLVRTTKDPMSLTPSVRSVLSGMDALIAPLGVKTIDDFRANTLSRMRFMTMMLFIFAVIGLTLSVVGVYGVLAQSSRNRTREVGIRMALGARHGAVRWLIVRQGLRLAIIGIIVGGAGALFVTKLMTKLLFEIAPNDPPTLAGVTMLLAATSALAAWIPAVRASQVDPTVALRAD
jgi:predicted permease